MNEEWQLPISARGRRDDEKRAHWFEMSTDTHRLVAAACGHRFNPGFASPARAATPRCATCLCISQLEELYALVR